MDTLRPDIQTLSLYAELLPECDNETSPLILLTPDASPEAPETSRYRNPKRDVRNSRLLKVPSVEFRIPNLCQRCKANKKSWNGSSSAVRDLLALQYQFSKV